MNFIYLLFFLIIHQSFSKYTFLTTIYYNTSDYVNENFLKNNFINKNLICGDTTPILIIERDNNKSYNIVLSLNHYEKVYQEYKTFNEINKNKSKYDIQYPELELILPKDD